MSHTSKELLEQAMKAGMPDFELERWQGKLTAEALDACGCKTSAIATAVVAVLGSSTVLIAGYDYLINAILMTAITAVIAKLFGQRIAKQRKKCILRALKGRIQQLTSLPLKGA